MRTILKWLLILVVIGLAGVFIANSTFLDELRSEMPSKEQVEEESRLTAPQFDSSATYKDLLRVNDPLPGETVTSPISIRGEARGPWFFEATFPVVLTDWDGRIIAEGFVEARDEWMTTEFVPFQGSLSFDRVLIEQAPSRNGTLIFQKSNASGLPEHDDAFEIPVIFE